MVVSVMHCRVSAFARIGARLVIDDVKRIAFNFHGVSELDLSDTWNSVTSISIDRISGDLQRVEQIHSSTLATVVAPSLRPTPFSFDRTVDARNGGRARIASALNSCHRQ